MRKTWMVILAILMIPLILLFIAVGGEIVKHLWNWLLPSIFGLRQITFWEALGVLLLSRILFGGFGWRGSGRSSIRRRVADRVADRVGDRWDAMTPEERERFRQRLRERCGFDPGSGESKASV